MDTKRLFLKTQTNIINWGLVIALAFAFLNTLFFFKGIKSISVYINLFFSLLLFTSMLATRISLKTKVALLPLATILGQLVFTLIDSAIRFKEIFAPIKNMQGPKTGVFLIILLSYSIYFLFAFLYYKVYKATRYIQELREV